MAIGANTWLTVCLHYNEPWEEFLAKALKPYFDVVLQTGVAERCFFERSNDRGPHIRLWFKSTEYLLNHILKPNLQEHFQQYYDSKPSFLIEPKYPTDYPDKYKWHPNNSVQFLDTPNPTGRPEMAIVDRQYLASSHIALAFLKDKNGRWSQNERTASAMKLHLAMLYACGLTLDQARQFVKWAYDNWSANYFRQNSGSHGAAESGVVTKSFQSFFDLQRKDVVAYQAAIWELLKNYRKVEDKVFVDWIHTNTNVNLEISLALDAGKLKPLNVGLVPSDATWTYYYDFIQKTNNRLGIFRKDEGYLFFMMAKGLAQLTHAGPVLAAFAPSK